MNMLAARELDCRSDGGLQVRLLWNTEDDSLVVTVVDSGSGDHFTVLVPRGARPLDVFRHPFAYAARV